ncbi:hypothetical protein AAG747_10895 [Rapidithrix thailandica]|uniref:Uncharacterized protein n=1 Tax=Rapidithrix thailandica TaxID=413964 RepID=A0AAW9SAQ4_9BACT
MSYSVEELRALLSQQNRPYLLHDDNAIEDDCARFYFIGKHQNKEVVFDAFLYPLEMEYFANLEEAAKDAVLELRPEFEGKDFEAEEGEHVEMLDQAIQELAEDEEFEVKEFVDVDDIDLPNVSLDACLHVPEINEEVVLKFVQDYTSGNLQLDPTFYSFSLDIEE